MLQAMIVDSGVSVPSLKVDGGMTANSLLMQFQADLLDVQVWTLIGVSPFWCIFFTLLVYILYPFGVFFIPF